jgi:5-methylcytosine-specific restriction endonuclease McrA
MAWEGSTRAKRLPPDWAKTRRRILQRDAYRCHVCEQPGADEVDHLRPGDDHSDANLSAICRSCHRTKSSLEGVRARRSGKRKPERHPGYKTTPGG